MTKRKLTTFVNYRFLDDEATADVAFEAWGRRLPEVFKAAADAVLNVMVEDLQDVRPREQRKFSLRNDRLDLLLYNFLEQLVYYKDAQRFLGKISRVEVVPDGNAWRLSAVAEGEQLDREHHHLRVDVKAITLHEFTLARKSGQWRAHIVLDI